MVTRTGTAPSAGRSVWTSPRQPPWQPTVGSPSCSWVARWPPSTRRHGKPSAEPPNGSGTYGGARRPPPAASGGERGERGLTPPPRQAGEGAGVDDHHGTEGADEGRGRLDLRANDVDHPLRRLGLRRVQGGDMERRATDPGPPPVVEQLLEGGVATERRPQGTDPSLVELEQRPKRQI